MNDYSSTQTGNAILKNNYKGGLVSQFPAEKDNALMEALKKMRQKRRETMAEKVMR